MKKKLFNYLTFSNKGELRGFAFGIKASDLYKDIEEIKGYTLVLVYDTSKIPAKFIEGNYWQFSKNNDLEFYINTIK